jgi:hypothetical protein
MGTTDRLTRAGWTYRGGLWIDPAGGGRYTERSALKTHERDVERGDGDAVDAELAHDADYLALLDARDLIETLDDEALSRSAPVTEADLFAADTAWAVGL